MPRQLRIDYPGAVHHVMSRGDRRENIYHDDVDRQDFLKTLAEACHKAAASEREPGRSRRGNPKAKQTCQENAPKYGLPPPTWDSVPTRFYLCITRLIWGVRYNIRQAI